MELPWHIRAIAYMLSCVKTELVKYLESSGVMSNSQHGFTKEDRVFRISWRPLKPGQESLKKPTLNVCIDNGVEATFDNISR